MITVLQDHPADLDVVLRTAPDGVPRAGLGPGDLICLRKPAGAPGWRPKVLSVETWREVGQGAYLLHLAAGELDAVGMLLLRIDGVPQLAPPIWPLLRELEVVAQPGLLGSRPELERTLIVGHIVGLDDRPIPRAAVSARLVQLPFFLQGVAVAGEAIQTRSADDGSFTLSLIRGATVDVEISILAYRRTLIVPPAPAPGAPVRLFSIP